MDSLQDDASTDPFRKKRLRKETDALNAWSGSAQLDVG